MLIDIHYCYQLKLTINRTSTIIACLTVTMSCFVNIVALLRYLYYEYLYVNRFSNLFFYCFITTFLLLILVYCLYYNIIYMIVLYNIVDYLLLSVISSNIDLLLYC